MSVEWRDPGGYDQAPPPKPSPLWAKITRAVVGAAAIVARAVSPKR